MIGYGESVAGRAYRTWRRFPVETMRKLKAHLEAGEVSPSRVDRCYVAWAVRDATTICNYAPVEAAKLFGDSKEAWEVVYFGVGGLSSDNAVRISAVPYIQSFELAMRDTLANANR